MDFDVDMPADLDQLGRDDSHGAVIGGKRFVYLGHFAAYRGASFHQMDIISRIRGIQCSLDSSNAAPDNHYGPQHFFGHTPPS
jgi:hypothetical protein